MLALKSRKGGLSTYTSNCSDGELKVKTDNKARPVIYWWELSKEEMEEYDFLDTQVKQEFAQFFRYKGQVWYLRDFLYENPGMGLGWDGSFPQSHFNGILVKYVDESCEYVKVGEWYA